MDVLIILVVGVVGFAVYFLPAIVAAAGGHRQQTAITVLNLFLGWTLLGWVIALVWACMKPPASDQRTAMEPRS